MVKKTRITVKPIQNSRNLIFGLKIPKNRTVHVNRVLASNRMSEIPPLLSSPITQEVATQAVAISKALIENFIYSQMLLDASVVDSGLGTLRWSMISGDCSQIVVRLKRDEEVSFVRMKRKPFHCDREFHVFSMYLSRGTILDLRSSTGYTQATTELN